MNKSFKRKSGMNSFNGDAVFFTATYIGLGILTLIIIYPLVYVVSASFSSPNAVSTGQVILWPVEFSLEGYVAVFKDKTIVGGYIYSIFYTVFGTVINLVITLAAAYPLSRPDMPGRGFLMFMFTFTMMFSGGMIPSYMLITDLKMTNTIWVMIIPGALSVYNLIIARTFMQSNIPKELLEAAQIDGCTNLRFFLKMVLPLSKSVIAVLTLFYGVAHWNAWFNAFLYMNEPSKYPLQLVLRGILLANEIDVTTILDPELALAKQGLADLLKYSLIVVSTVPMLCIYPFVKKHFVTGVMIGSIKG